MTDRPILFSAPMIRALLAGTKTQTRRLIRDEVRDPPGVDAIHPENTPKHPAPYLDSYCGGKRNALNPRGMSDRWCWWTRDDRQCLPTFKVPYVPGDRLWVKETHQFANSADGPCILLRATGSRWSPEWTGPDEGAGSSYDYNRCPGDYSRWAADVERANGPWRSSLFMRRWASRLTLLVTEVRVQRLQYISDDDAVAEGVSRAPGGWWSGAEGQAGDTPRAAYGVLWNSLHGPDAWNANPWVVAATFDVIHANIDAPAIEHPPTSSARRPVALALEVRP